MVKSPDKLFVACVLLMAVLLGACERHDEMVDQPRQKPYSGTTFFVDGLSERPLVAGTVSRTDPLEIETAKKLRPIDSAPMAITLTDLRRGQQRFEIYCTACHGATGDGDGMVVRRGFPTPPTFHSAKLRSAPLTHFYDVITNGYGAMYSFNERISPEDRWRIAAYIRALQFSRTARKQDLTADDLQHLPTVKP